jgi:uncharacterized protein
MASHPYTNHLIQEKSPYLQQHAHNPVDWYPWGEEAFALAKSQDKPIFLSIGYATCHWCHVMEKESFADPEIGSVMNDAFINIKVDREERPEVDGLYMEFAQALMSAPGGWPLNLILTPDLKPFFAITYLPARTKQGMMGMVQFTQHIKQLWTGEERSRLVEQADQIVEIFQKMGKPVGMALPKEEHLLRSVEVMFEMADPIFGGMKGEPKFPPGYQLLFLLEFAKRKSDSRALFYVQLTLDMMQRGGIYDHIGGGFARYCVDERWQIPHFEKMLYDNAILASLYLEAWKFTKNGVYEAVCKEILRYLLRDMAHPEGGFYSAEDADSEGQEGKFYTWTFSEIQETAPSLQEAHLFCKYYGVTEAGNFEGRNVLHIVRPLEEFAQSVHMPAQEIEQALLRVRSLLFEKRQKRVRPFKDDKILASWNGLAIDALAKAALSFNEPTFGEGAKQAASFIKTHLWKEGRLLRRYRTGESRFDAGLEEYAYLMKGVLTLFEKEKENQWLEWAVEMAAILERDFKEVDGAFYQTDGREAMLVRKCEFNDGAEPSGNGVHCENLLRLYQITSEEKYKRQAEDILKAALPLIESYSPGACSHLFAFQKYQEMGKT